MSVNISKLSVLLTGNIDGFQAAMKLANHSAREFGDGIKEHIAHVAEFAEALALVEVAKHAAESLVEHTKATFEAIDSEAKLADSLGISTQALGGLKYAASYAGASVEDVSNGLLHMEKSLEAAKGGTDGAAKALEMLHLDAKELQAEAPDEAFKRIADGLKEMDNASQRNSVAFEIFGKGVKPLLPLLAGGSEEINKFSEEAEKLGFSFNRVDAAKIEAANDAITKTSNIAQGALNQLAIISAPYIEALANKLNDVAMSGNGIKGLVIPAFEGMAQGVAYVGDGVKGLESAWYLVKAGVILVAEESIKSLAELSHALDFVLEKLHQKPTGLTDTLVEMTNDLQRQVDEQMKMSHDAGDAASLGENHKKISAFFDSIQKGAQESAEATAKLHQSLGGIPKDLDADSKKIEKILDDLKKQVDEFGKSDSQKKADELRGLGANAEQLEQADALAKQREELEAAQKAQKDMASDAARLWESVQTPLEKYNNELDKANTLLNKGLIDQETFDRASGKALEDLDKSQKTDKGAEHEIPKLLAAGTVEASSFIARISARERGGDAQQQLVKGQDKGNGFLADIRDSIKDMASALGNDEGVSL